MTKSEKEKFELIEKFIENTLSAEEKEKFDSALNSDPDFAKEVKVHQDVHDILIDRGLLNVKEQLQKIHKNETGGSLFNYKLYGALATAFLVGGLIYYMYQTSKSSYTDKAPKGITSEERIQSNNNTPDHRQINERSQTTFSGTDDKNTNPSVISDTKNNPVQSGEVLPNTTVPKDTTGTPPVTKTPAPKDTSSGSSKGNMPGKKADPCASVQITGTATPMPSCKEEDNGSIIVHINSLKGGKGPYKYSIENDTDFMTSASFLHLGPGTYKLFVRDANGCSNFLKEVTVDGKECTSLPPANFHPKENQPWTIPVKNNGNGKLQIFNRAGIIVYSVNINNGYPNTWNGTDYSGQLLSGGLYSYMITYDDQSISQGDVTIIY